MTGGRRTISGGERQRAALARSLVLDPSVLLLDEPLSALDHATQSRIIDDLRALERAHGIPILYVTHAHREVFALGERVIALDAGRIVADGTPARRARRARHGSRSRSWPASKTCSPQHVVGRRPEAGTMPCRLDDGTELEVPHRASGRRRQCRLAIRAGDILLATAEPMGFSARNIIAGLIGSLQARRRDRRRRGRRRRALRRPSHTGAVEALKPDAGRAGVADHQDLLVPRRRGVDTAKTVRSAPWHC